MWQIFSILATQINTHLFEIKPDHRSETLIYVLSQTQIHVGAAIVSEMFQTLLWGQGMGHLHTGTWGCWSLPYWLVANSAHHHWEIHSVLHLPCNTKSSNLPQACLGFGCCCRKYLSFLIWRISKLIWVSFLLLKSYTLDISYQSKSVENWKLLWLTSV